MTYVRLLLLLTSISLLNLFGCSTTAVAPQTQQVQTTEGSAQQKPGQGTLDPRAMAAYKPGLNAIEQGNNDEAIKIFTGMTSSFPEFSGPHTNLGLIYFRDGDMGRAEKAFQQSISINPENAIAHNHLGIIYRHQGRFNDAEKSYLSAIQHQPDYANAHLNLGILYDIYLLKLDSALRHYEKFQSLQQSEDGTVKNWIVGLQRRVKGPK